MVKTKISDPEKLQMKFCFNDQKDIDILSEVQDILFCFSVS